MIYTHEDNHPIVRALKKCAGWWIDCAVSYGTEHFETHRIINGKWLGVKLKDALKEVRSDLFPSNGVN